MAWTTTIIVPTNDGGGVPIMAVMLVSSKTKPTGGFSVILACNTSLGFLKSPRRKITNGTPAGIFTREKDELSVVVGKKLNGVAVEVAADPVIEVIPSDENRSIMFI